MTIQGAVALVTGANRGLGSALVDALVKRGVRHVYATSRDPRVSESSVGDDIRITKLRMDVTDDTAIANVARLASDVTLLINNAGVLTPGDPLDVAPTQISKELETNCVGLINVVRHFAPVIEQNGGGVILNVLSISALASSPSISVYSASKAAAWSLTQAMRATLAARRIRVLGAFPGPVDTGMTRDLQVPKARPEDVADAMLNGLERGEEDIFPDAMSKQASAIWHRSPKSLEQQFALL